jgi:RimJ/RimL family protein N-acetyltransferase
MSDLDGAERMYEPLPLTAAVARCSSEILTARLRLRQWSDDDLASYAAICADPEVMRFIGDGHACDHHETRDRLGRIREHWENEGFGLWAATLRADDRLVGFIGLSTPTFLPEVLPAVEIGWRLGREHWGHGLATEGAAAALADGFSRLGVEQILAIYQPANLASWRVMEKLGMTHLRDTVDPIYGFPLRIYRAGSDVRTPRPHLVSAE